MRSSDGFILIKVMRESCPPGGGGESCGHRHEIEALVVDEASKVVVSLCLEGKIVVWDACSGESIACISKGTSRYLFQFNSAFDPRLVLVYSDEALLLLSRLRAIGLFPAIIARCVEDAEYGDAALASPLPADEGAPGVQTASGNCAQERRNAERIYMQTGCRFRT